MKNGFLDDEKMIIFRDWFVICDCDFYRNVYVMCKFVI